MHTPAHIHPLPCNVHEISAAQIDALTPYMDRGALILHAEPLSGEPSSPGRRAFRVTFDTGWVVTIGQYGGVIDERHEPTRKQRDALAFLRRTYGERLDTDDFVASNGSFIVQLRPVDSEYDDASWWLRADGTLDVR
jgi:hypothetical protein